MAARTRGRWSPGSGSLPLFSVRDSSLWDGTGPRGRKRLAYSRNVWKSYSELGGHGAIPETATVKEHTRSYLLV